MKKKLLSMLMTALLLVTSSVMPVYADVQRPVIDGIYADGNSVILVWYGDFDDSVDYYKIYRSTSTKGFKCIDTTKEVAYMDTDVVYGTRYYYKVKAVLESGYSTALSKYKSAKVVWTADDFPTGDLDRPVLTTFTDDDQDCIWLMWDAIDNANVYYIYRSTSKKDPFELKYYYEDDGNTVLIYDDDIKQNKRYYYKVQALNFDEDTGTVLGSKPSLWRSNITYQVTKATRTSTSSSYNTSQTVYITNTGSKYHNYGCQYLRQSCISISKSNAINQGYTACSRCW